MSKFTFLFVLPLMTVLQACRFTSSKPENEAASQYVSTVEEDTASLPYMVEQHFNFLTAEMLLQDGNLWDIYHNLMLKNYRANTLKYLYPPVLLDSLTGIYAYYSAVGLDGRKQAVIEFVNFNIVYHLDYIALPDTVIPNYNQGLSKTVYSISDTLNVRETFKINTIFKYDLAPQIHKMIVVLGESHTAAGIRYRAYVFYLFSPASWLTTDVFLIKPNFLAEYMSRRHLTSKEAAIRLLDSLKTVDTLSRYFVYP